MRRKKQFTNNVKFNLQYNKRWSLLSDLSNLRKLVLDGKLFRFFSFYVYCVVV